MKRKSIIIYVDVFIAALTLLFIALAAGPFVYWRSLASTDLKVWIVDKTVPLQDYREHKGLMWILNHNKIINAKTGANFVYSSDYFGYFPLKGEEYNVKNIPESKENPDLIYLTDTYGVYTDDFSNSKLKNTKSELVYGGLDSGEINRLNSSLTNGNTIIGEFNIASDPTNRANRIQLGKIFGVKWTGYKGRYFKELSKGIEVPEGIVENYESQQKEKWKFSGAGYVIVSDEDEIIVLEEKKDVKKNGMNISFKEEYRNEFGVKKEVPYRYWFEFINPEPGRDTIASYKLDVTESGREILKKHGLSEEFPAVVRYNNSQYNSYYFAGDFADIENVNGLWRYYGYDKIKAFASSFNKENPEYFYWNCYAPMMKKILGDIKLEKAERVKRETVKAQAEKQGIRKFEMYAKTSKTGFQILKGGKWEDFFVKGVNLGAAVPGKGFTEFPEDEGVYLDWFNKMGEMNANSIRVYTLLPPEFYNALWYYNKKHEDKPLWLLQEIWPEENPEGQDYLKQQNVEEYYKEIENVVNAVHGSANILERKGRAYGTYKSDVSRYVLGYLVGRELEPEEVVATNAKNIGFAYKGQYLSSDKGASPTEAWLSMNCDYLLKYEEGKYNTQHPVAIVSWPTLDITEHDSEWNALGQKDKEYNDKVSVDINNISVESKMIAGFFGAYHIYPNYPDFMNNESKYDSYSDEQGRFRYGGYLKEFIDKQVKYPALVAEFGLSTGEGNAHTSPDGYNHGGLTEEQQGEGIVRMMKTINKEGYAGGLIFEWMDEWAKKTWITEPFMIPYERHNLWHNAVDPEQNYGLLAMETVMPKEDGSSGSSITEKSDGDIRKITLNQDAAFLYMDVALTKVPDFSGEKLLIGLDTYDRQRGEFKFASDMQLKAPTGLEFLLDITSDKNAKLLVTPSYNTAKGTYSSRTSESGIFEEMKPLINNGRITKDKRIIEPIYADNSKLNYGEFDNNSYNQWYLEGSTLHIRIPWTRLNFTDPSTLTVLDDTTGNADSGRDKLHTVKTEGIMVSALLMDINTHKELDILSTEKAYDWKPWEQPQYKERLKKSYFIIQKYFGSM